VNYLLMKTSKLIEIVSSEDPEEDWNSLLFNYIQKRSVLKVIDASDALMAVNLLLVIFFFFFFLEPKNKFLPKSSKNPDNPFSVSPADHCTLYLTPSFGNFLPSFVKKVMKRAFSLVLFSSRIEEKNDSP